MDDVVHMPVSQTGLVNSGELFTRAGALVGRIGSLKLGIGAVIRLIGTCFLCGDMDANPGWMEWEQGRASYFAIISSRVARLAHPYIAASCFLESNL